MSVDTVPAPAPADASASAPAQGTTAAATADGSSTSNATATATGAAGVSSPTPGGGRSNNTEGQFTLRALVSSKEAGIIIGKGGKNVADLRDATGVKAGVSKVVQGVPERVLSVTGTLEGVTKVGGASHAATLCWNACRTATIQLS